MGGFSYRTIDERIRFHRHHAQIHEESAARAIKKERVERHLLLAEFHCQRAVDWEGILSQVQELQRLEQVKAENLRKAPPAPKRTTRATNRNAFARELLKQHAKDGITPAEVRRLANQQGFVTPSNYPYKCFKFLRRQRRIRRDEKGQYFPIDL